MAEPPAERPPFEGPGVGRPFRGAMSEENYDSQLRDQGYSPFKLPGERAPAIFPRARHLPLSAPSLIAQKQPA